MTEQQTTFQAAAIESSNHALAETFQLQKAAFRRNPYPTYKERIEALRILEATIKKFRPKIEAALTSDFCTHPPLVTAAVEMLGPVARARFARAHLKGWMKPQRRAITPLLYGTSKNYVLYQPVGVVGNMTPWNFPIDLSLGPLADILAAGNRCIIKPSELAPASAELVREMVASAFDRDLVAVVTGDIELAKTFPTLPWDHLLYTGGPAIGRLVMKAAAENLTPVTLELGGKCPVIIDRDSLTQRTVADILSTKLIKGGQMCITVDYALVPEERVDDFVAMAQAEMAKMMPSYVQNPQSTGIINDRHLDRLLHYVADAKRKGAKLVPLGSSDEAIDRTNRKLPFYLVLDAPEDAEVIRNEIFGPLLPVKPYRTLQDAIDYITRGERPLALYIYSKDKACADRVLRQTLSGGACVNAAAVHAAQPSLPFGGIGQSGMGKHHGFEGFVTFSHSKAVFEAGIGFNPSLLYPPYGKKLERVLRLLLGS